MVLHGGRLLVVMKIIVLILFRKVTNWYNNFNLNLKQGLLVTMLAPFPSDKFFVQHFFFYLYTPILNTYLNAYFVNAHNIERMSEFFERDQRAEFCQRAPRDQRAQYWKNVIIL